MSTRRRSPVVLPEPDPHSCTVGMRHEVLARTPFLAGLTAAEIDVINEQVQVRNYEAGEAVYHAGRPARRLYVVAVGTAKLSRPTLEGREVLLDVARPGDFLGALPVLGEDEHQESAWAVTALCLLSLAAADFDAILDRHPSVARAGLEVVSRRLRDAQARIHRLSAATAEQRVAAALALLAERAGRPSSGGVLIEVPLARDDLAAMTGSASETVSRVLSRLRRDGVVDTGRRWVRILDPAALATLAES